MTTAYLYAGQGAQKAGMGKDLYENFEAFRKAFDSADLSFDLHRVCFEDPDGVLIQTQYTQPCLAAVETGITAVLREAGLRPDYAAGLSLGEYSALEAAEVLTAEETIRMTAFRGEAMAGASAGIDCGMTAVLGLSEASLENCCREAEGEGVVSICNYNCPGQLVISGDKEGILEACDKLKAAGAKRALPLKVGGAFHSPLMQSAKEELQAAIEKTQFAKPVCPVYQNVDAMPHTDPEEIKQNLIAQLTSSVRWTKSVQNMIADGADEFVECGPGKALRGMIGRIDKNVKATGLE